MKPDKNKPDHDQEKLLTPTEVDQNDKSETPAAGGEPADQSHRLDRLWYLDFPDNRRGWFGSGN